VRRKTIGEKKEKNILLNKLATDQINVDSSISKIYYISDKYEF